MTIQYTHKTADGRLARIVCTDRKSSTHPVVAMELSSDHQQESVVYLTEGLCRTVSDDGHWPNPYLIERSVWEDVKVDQPVYVNAWGGVIPRHFFKYDGKHVWVFSDGRTSHTSHTTDAHPYEPSIVSLEKPADA